MDDLVLDEEPPPRPAADKRKGIRPQSCKAKGRKFQQEIERRLKEIFPLEGNDVRSTSMGCSGSDLVLSPRALAYLPYDFELKNQENVQLWATLKQTRSRIDETVMPLVVIRKNRTKPVAVVPIVHFIHLCTGTFGQVVADVTLECLGVENGATRPAKEQALQTAVNAAWSRWAPADHDRPSLPVCSRQSLSFWDTVNPNRDTGVVLNRGQSDFPIVVALSWERFEALIAAQVAVDAPLPAQAAPP